MVSQKYLMQITGQTYTRATRATGGGNQRRYGVAPTIMTTAESKRAGGRNPARSGNIPGQFMVVAVLAMALVPCMARAQWVTDLEAGAFVNDNVGLATAGTDVHSASGLTTAVASGPFFELAPGTNLVLRGEARETGFSRYTGLDSLSLGAQARLDTKFGLGREAPHAYLLLAHAQLTFRDAMRSGSTQTVAVGTRSMFGERLGLRAEAAIDQRRGRDLPAPVRAGVPSNVFDQYARRVSLGGDFRVAEPLLLQLDAALRRGDADYIETTDIATDSFAGAAAVASDAVFGPGVVLEKVQSRALLLDARLSWSIGEHTSLNFAFRRQVTLDTSGALYTRSVPSVTLQYRID
jgi:hypothetical protein